MPICQNCGNARAEVYCPSCGQEQSTEITLAGWIGEVLDELLFVEKKLPRTLTQLLRPGVLTRAWMTGQRARYVRPFRLFLLCATVALLSSLLEGAVLGYTSTGQTVLRVYLIAFAVPVFAIASRIGFSGWRSSKSLMPYVVYSLHFHAYVLLLVTIATLIRLVLVLIIGSIPEIVFAPLGLIILWYLTMSGQTAFGLLGGRAALGAIVSLAVYVGIAFPVLWVVAAYVLAR